MPNTKIHLRIKFVLLRKANRKDIYLFQFISGILDPDTINSPNDSFFNWINIFYSLEKKIYKDAKAISFVYDVTVFNNKYDLNETNRINEGAKVSVNLYCLFFNKFQQKTLLI